MAATDPASPGNTPSDQAARLVDGILGMYRRGWFPMADPNTGRIDWYQPRKRGVIPLDPDDFRISRNLRQKVRSGRFEIRCDTAFPEVIAACAQPRSSEDQTWIDDRIIEAYCLLHESGHTHSVEAWLASEKQGAVLVGGLYGLHIGGAFFGESMFSRPALGGTDASKVCLVHLVHHLRRRGMTLLDAQLWNEHLSQFGCRELPRGAFMRLLASAIRLERQWGAFEPCLTIAELSGRPSNPR